MLDIVTVPVMVPHVISSSLLILAKMLIDARLAPNGHVDSDTVTQVSVKPAKLKQMARRSIHFICNISENMG